MWKNKRGQEGDVLRETWVHAYFLAEVKNIPIMFNTQSVPVERIQCEMPPDKKLIRRIWKRCVGERKPY